VRSADAELLRELALGRQLVAGLQQAGGDARPDAVADLLERAPHLDRLEGRHDRIERTRRGVDGLRNCVG